MATAVTGSSRHSKTPQITQPLKWWGGKKYLAQRIIDLMPRHLHYVEPYGGGLAVLLAKDPLDPRHRWGRACYEQGVSEVVNDIHRPLQNFWSVLRCETAYAAFIRQVEFERVGDRMVPTTPHDVDAAVAFFVRCRQSRAGDFRAFAPLTRNRTRRKQNEQASAWWNAVEGLAAVHARLKRVVILCGDALQVIGQQDGEKTLFYLDPPYLGSTRASTGNYACEMTDDDHQEMLATIRQCKGSVMLSGYASGMYDAALAYWNRHEFQIDNKAAGGKSKQTMTELVWCNF